MRALENGQTLFDMGTKAHPTDLAQWEAILDWLRPIAKLPPAVKPVIAAPQAPVAVPPQQPSPAPWPNAERAPSLMPAQAGLVHGNVYAMAHPAQKVPASGGIAPNSALAARLQAPQGVQPVGNRLHVHQITRVQ